MYISILGYFIDLKALIVLQPCALSNFCRPTRRQITFAALVSLDVEHCPCGREVGLDHLQAQVLRLGQRAVHHGDGGRHETGEEEEGPWQASDRR